MYGRIGGLTACSTPEQQALSDRRRVQAQLDSQNRLPAPALTQQELQEALFGGTVFRIPGEEH